MSNRKARNYLRDLKGVGCFSGGHFLYTCIYGFLLSFISGVWPAVNFAFPLS